MRYIIASLLLLALLLAFCCWSTAYINHAVEKTTVLLQEAMVQHRGGDRGTSMYLVQQARQHWDSHQTAFGMLLRHDQVDDVVGEFARLHAYALTGDRDEFLSNCAALLAQLEHIRKMEFPYLHNLL